LLFRGGRTADTVLAVEMKGGKARVNEVVEQLQQGANIVDTISSTAPLDFQPLLVHSDGSLRSIDRMLLRQKKIKFRGKSLLIETKKCGYAPLS